MKNILIIFLLMAATSLSAEKSNSIIIKYLDGTSKVSKDCGKTWRNQTECIEFKRLDGSSKVSKDGGKTWERQAKIIKFIRLDGSTKLSRDGGKTWQKIQILAQNNIDNQANYIAINKLNLRILAKRDEEGVINIYNISSILVNRSIVNVKTGDNNLEINVSNLSNGNYFYNILYGNEFKKGQFIISR